jgi:hypothetical protein
LALTPDEQWSMIVVVDDATSHILYAQMFDEESTTTIMTALRDVFTTHGLSLSLYCDRASWAFYTPTAGGSVRKDVFTQVGRALDHLGIEHIPAYSPQARGRSERANRTLQDRLVNELKAAGITDRVQANAYIRDVYIPDHNRLFGVEPSDPTSVFII